MTRSRKTKSRKNRFFPTIVREYETFEEAEAVAKLAQEFGCPYAAAFTNLISYHAGYSGKVDQAEDQYRRVHASLVSGN
jgi:hypothetical protein